MKRNSCNRFATETGFTLVELIVVIVLLSIAAAGIVSLNANIFSGQDSNETLEVGAQLLQECAEKVLAAGYTPSPSCLDDATASALPQGFSAPVPTVTHTILPATSTRYGCPSGGTCVTVDVTVTKGSSTLTPITLLLVQ